jgi:hypothetical protein
MLNKHFNSGTFDGEVSAYYMTTTWIEYHKVLCSVHFI